MASGMEMMLKSMGLDTIIEDMKKPLADALVTVTQMRDAQLRIEKKLDDLLSSEGK